ncbi:type 2 lanthipeptide synthetase LanM, partial [Salmonella enterica subsp. enterica serovar Typhimurium]|nr:type 2 lanthipeptide synthetase LanM [Salmonella enterica subsp. enterica serovar Typhimurium]
DIEMIAFFLRFQDLLGVDIFYPVENIDKGTYGWSRAVPLQDCGSADRVANHYKGLGIFTALAHALKIEDIIFDNLISTNGRLA